MFEDKLIDFKKGERQRQRERDRQGEREINMHMLKRGWTKESITEMLIHLVL